MAQVLESMHRADRAVIMLQDALKGSATNRNPATAHGLAHGADMLELTLTEQRKFKDLLSSTKVLPDKTDTIAVMSPRQYLQLDAQSQRHPVTCIMAAFSSCGPAAVAWLLCMLFVGFSWAA